VGLTAIAVTVSMPCQQLATARADRSREVRTTAAAASDVVGDAGFDSLVMPRLPVAAAAPGPTPVLEPIAAPLSFDGPPPAPVAPPTVLTAPPSGGAGTGTWAVVIGVDDYPGSRYDLRAARNDALAVQDALARLGTPPEQVLALHDGQAGADVIRAAAGWLADNAGPDAVAVFFFAGHVRKLGPGAEALVAADGREVRDHELARLLAPMPARSAWIAIAGCYGGGFTEVMAAGRVLTGAAPADQMAYENTALPRSYMVEYMVQQAIVEGRAADTVQTAFAYARDALARDYPGRQPVQVDATDGALSLGRRAPASAPAEPGPPPPPQSPPPTPPTTEPPPRDCFLGVVC
jgi:hypothetical protein